MIEDKAVEIYNRLRDELRRDFERLVDEYLGRSNVDERVITSMVKAIVGKEIARLKAEVEELGKQGVDAELLKQMINEIYNRLLNDLTNIIDQRIIHLAQIVEEKSSDIKDILDLINEVLKLEVEFEEKIEELRNTLSEEALEERFYRMLMKKGVIRQRRRRWVPLIAGLSVLAAIIAGFIINPIVTFVIIAIAIVILLRW